MGAMDVIAGNLGIVEKAKIIIHDGREEEEVDRVFEVPFNPSSLAIRARGSGFIAKLNLMQNAAGVDPQRQDVRVTVSFRLVIDQVFNFGAFMEDKMNMSPSQIGQNIAGSIVRKKTKSANVQQIVEGFMSTIRNPQTQHVTFQWGSMKYEGLLNNISSQYVMFDVLGHPVRAYINVSITCVSQEMSAEKMAGNWLESYKEAFSGDTLDNRKKGAQLATNLLNLG